MKRAIAFALSVAALPLAGAAAVPANPVLGIWMNPHKSVAVEVAPCGEKLCGRVVWASSQAIEDARSSGVDRLIGTELLENYSPRSDGSWSGHVFVPDLGGRFASTIIVVGPDTLRISGCMLGGLICKGQLWQRYTGRPGG